MKLLWKIKSIYILSKNRNIRIGKNSVLRSGSEIKSYNGHINIGTGCILEKMTKLSACDGGKLEIGNNVYFNVECKVVARSEIVIKDNVLFGPRVMIYDHNHKFNYDGVVRDEFSNGSVYIGEGCWIGAGVTILKGAHIGKGSIIGAGTVIKGVVPEHSLVCGSGEVIIEEIKRDM